ncbi:MAG: DUF2459 domain-containing protein [Phycisphaerae bacterium]|nr:DUF2459 domain-containing protein [Phycisphaerae bacterium]
MPPPAKAIRLLTLLLVAGCTTLVTPPQHVEKPVTVFLKLDAAHSAVLLPRSETDYVEYSFGAFRWFALGDTRWPVGVASLLGLMRSTLQATTVEIRDGLPLTVAQHGVLPLRVERARAEALRMELDARFLRQVDTYHYNDRYNMSFVQDREHYWFLNNCNQVTARWLRRLGCHLTGFGLTNDFRLAAPAKRP